jgi:hypothetical protein
VPCGSLTTLHIDRLVMAFVTAQPHNSRESQRSKAGDRRRVEKSRPALMEVVVDPEEPPEMPGKLKA